MRIEFIHEKKLVGFRAAMSLSSDQTWLLWNRFMPRLREVRQTKGNDLFSVEIYPSHFFDHVDPATAFEKWAAVEVIDFQEIPAGLETLLIPPGQYAVFCYKGDSAKAYEVYSQIFGVWLPQAGFSPDDRPHFTCMGEKYRNHDPESEEEIWIPVRETERANHV